VRSFPSDHRVKVDSDFIGVIKRTVDFSNKKTSASKQSVTEFFTAMIDSLDKNVKSMLRAHLSRAARDTFSVVMTTFWWRERCSFTQSSIRKQSSNSRRWHSSGWIDTSSGFSSRASLHRWSTRRRASRSRMRWSWSRKGWSSTSSLLSTTWQFVSSWPLTWRELRLPLTISDPTSATSKVTKSTSSMTCLKVTKNEYYYLRNRLQNT
jgi:hypothetical protein